MGPWNDTFKAIVDRWYNESILCKCDKSNLFPRCDRNPDYCTKRSNVAESLLRTAEATARDQK